MKAQLDVLEVDVSAAKQSRDRYVEAIGSSKAPVAALMLKVTEAEAVLSKCEHESASVGHNLLTCPVTRTQYLKVSSKR